MYKDLGTNFILLEGLPFSCVVGWGLAPLVCMIYICKENSPPLARFLGEEEDGYSGTALLLRIPYLQREESSSTVLETWLEHPLGEEWSPKQFHPQLCDDCGEMLSAACGTVQWCVALPAQPSLSQPELLFLRMPLLLSY